MIAGGPVYPQASHRPTAVCARLRSPSPEWAAKPRRYDWRYDGKEKLRASLTRWEAEATLQFIASRGQGSGDWLDSRPEDEPLSPAEQAVLAASDPDIAAGRTISYAEVEQRLEAG
jgi:hypothetical protein